MWLKIYRTIVVSPFVMGVKLGLSYSESNVG